MFLYGVWANFLGCNILHGQSPRTQSFGGFVGGGIVSGAIFLGDNFPEDHHPGTINV